MSTATVSNIKTGDVVPNWLNMPIKIVDIVDGYYIGAGDVAIAWEPRMTDEGVRLFVASDFDLSAYIPAKDDPPAASANGNGAKSAAADFRPIADTNELTFQVDVSRTYRNKDGYDVSGYKLNTSFVTETHTIESFIETVVKEGWPYTMVHAKRTPQETGAAARGVHTPKHTENFISSQLLTFDDDSKSPGVIDFWLNNPFFGRYGLAFIESVNSKPGEAEKGHPTALLDRAITDPDEYRDCLKAFYFAFPHLDHLINIDRTIYNAQGARVHLIGAICPFEEFERTYLIPYRAAEREKAAAIEAERERRRQEAERAKAEGRTVSHSLEEAYLAGYLRWMFDHVAAKHAGDNRNKSIYWAGRCIAGIEATEWAKPYLHLLADAETRIVGAAAANGYLADHAHGNEREVLRVFDLGRRAGGEPIDPPTPSPTFSANGKVANVQSFTQIEPPASPENGNDPPAGYLPPSSIPRSMRELMTHHFPPQQYLIYDLIAKGNLAVVAGRQKAGKSWLILQSVMSIDTGVDFLGRETTKAKILYYPLEDGDRRLQRRARAIGWQPENAAVLFSIPYLDDGQGGPGPGVDEIARYSQEYDLIIIDTLIAAMSGRTDERDNSSMGAILNALASIAHNSDTAIVLVHHTGKSVNPDDVFSTLRGASAIRGAYDVGLILERKPGEREAILHAESRDLDIRNMTLRQAENGAGWEYVGDAHEIEKVRAGRKVLETMLDHDDGDGMTTEKIAEIRKVSKATIHKQLTRLEADGYVCRDVLPSTQMGKRPDVWRVVEGYR